MVLGQGGEEVSETKLKPCPFCGGKAEIKRCNVYLDDALQVRCTECGTSQPKEIPNHRLYTGGKEIFLTEAMLIEKITNRWNRRADDEQRKAD